MGYAHLNMFHIDLIREGSRYQIRWIFGKNSKWPLTPPPPPHLWKIILQIFFNGYGCICARSCDDQILWNACTWFPEIWTILRGGVNCRVEPFRKFIWFGSVTRPFRHHCKLSKSVVLWLERYWCLWEGCSNAIMSGREELETRKIF